MSGQFFTTKDGASLFYTTEGFESAPLILLLHGWSCDQNDWVLQYPFLLSLGFRVVGLDLRGHGRSTVSSSITAFDPITQAEDTAGLLKHLGTNSQSQALVLGHSFGGLLANELALRHPDLIRGIGIFDGGWNMTKPILDDFGPKLDAAAAPDITAVGRTGYALMEAIPGIYAPNTPAWVLPWHRRRVWGTDSRVLLETFRQMRTHLGESGAKYLEAKKTKGIPRFVTCSHQGSYSLQTEEVGVEEGFETVKLLPGGHWNMIAESERFNELLKGWLEKWHFIP
ncbi:Alpha/Beta hydrolase protein [Xylariaceae sp. FL0255]|nr:Alpha/Beta hydrolase protein [Xylariaceae sp. FL0255]